jgi:NTE family protein
VRRLAREIGGRLVGLALSSGAAKGFAHIGVIQVLEENGIEVDVIAGSSMGAYVGSLWAYGLDGTELERLAREMEGRWAVWTLLDPVFPPRQGFLRGLALKKRLMRSIGNARFADLPRPMRIVAGNLATLERMVFTSGEVAAAYMPAALCPAFVCRSPLTEKPTLTAALWSCRWTSCGRWASPASLPGRHPRAPISFVPACAHGGVRAPPPNRRAQAVSQNLSGEPGN